MRTLVFEGLVTAETSIYHGSGESYGIETLFRREKIVQPDGAVEEVPIISGNAIRGILRDCGMLFMCREIGLTEMPLMSFYTLFSGGALTGSSEGVDLDEARRLRELIPLLSVFGAAIGGRILNGKLRVGKLIPICRETLHLLPERFYEAATARVSCYELLQQETYTRRDDEKNERLRMLIEPEARRMLEDPATRDLARQQAGMRSAQQMRYIVETIAAGTHFYWRIELEDVTDIEFAAFLTALLEFHRNPVIGGRGAVGHGRLRIRLEYPWKEISEVRVETREVDVPPITRYVQHLQAHSDEIRELLLSLR